MKKIHKNWKNGKEKIKKILTKTRGNVKVKVIDFQHHIAAYVRKNPMKSLGISLLAGALISQIRRLRK